MPGRLLYAQRAAAPRADRRAMVDHLVWGRHLSQGRPLVACLAARLPARLLALIVDTRRLLEPITRWAASRYLHCSAPTAAPTPLCAPAAPQLTRPSRRC